MGYIGLPMRFELWVRTMCVQLDICFAHSMQAGVIADRALWQGSPDTVRADPALRNQACFRPRYKHRYLEPLRGPGPAFSTTTSATPTYGLVAKPIPRISPSSSTFGRSHHSLENNPGRRPCGQIIQIMVVWPLGRIMPSDE